MKKFNSASARVNLDQLSTEQLDEMLREELKKDPLDDGTIRLILDILEKREADLPVSMDAETAAAWAKFSACEEKAERKSPFKQIAGRKWMLKVASVILALVIFVPLLSQEVHAKAMFEMMVRWTDSIFQVFTPDAVHDNQVVYEFKTDHPGLQQVYDAVTELGVTDPVVPMWLPDGYELTELKEIAISRKTVVSAVFEDGNNTMVFLVEIFREGSSSNLHKSEVNVMLYEKAGITHNILKNDDKLVAAWTRNNVGCALTIKCQEDVLYQIIESVYIMEGK